MNLTVNGIRSSYNAHIKVGGMLNTVSAREQYRDWSLGEVLQSITDSDVEKALTVVTFKSPISYDEFEDIINLSSGQTIIESVQVAVEDTTNLTQELGTLSAGNIINNKYQNRIEEIIADVGNSLIQSTEEISGSDTLAQRELSPVGVFAATIWVDSESLQSLNTSPVVYLADAAPTYARMLASELSEVESANQTELSPDGYPASLSTSVHNLYYTLPFDSESVPTSIKLTSSRLIYRSYQTPVYLLTAIILVTIVTQKNLARVTKEA